MNQVELSRRGTSRAVSLMCGASVAIVAAFSAAGASAQTPPPSAATEVTEVIVTGSSIRGAPPVGSNLVSVGQETIQKTGAQTVQQVLRSVPSVVGMGAVGQGAFGSADGAGTNAPTIHGLGASASNSTLILIDGHRFPLSGINHALADPNILAPLALERVEVLADGASSVYGSDAVAGVINFITRRNFDGIEGRGQAGYADGYNSYGAGIVAGKTWDTGSVLAAFGYSDRDGLLAAKRDFTARDRRLTGGSNLASFFCAPATIQVGSGNIIPAPYNGAGVANAAANALCDTSGVIDLIPSERRYSAMVKVSQELTENLKLSGDVVYSDRRNVNRDSRGTIQATIFGPGAANTAQINPFFVAPAGSTATSESVRFDANQLLGPGAHTNSGEETGYISGSAEYKFNDNWRLTAGGVAGFSNSFSDVLGGLCSSCANLALNGTTNGGGNATAASIPGTSTIILNTPLTAANALDVFNNGAANRTSAAVLARLVDSESLSKARQTIGDATLKLDGSAFDLPAGPVKVAVGLEYIKYTLDQHLTRPNNTGPATTGSSFLHLNYDRNVKSAYAEVLVPVVSPEMGVPMVRSLDVNVSGRYDKYSDFGSTSNPRIAANWGVIEGLKFRANYAKSFVAPALTSRGADTNGTTAETSVSLFAGTLNVPTAAYPNIIGLPGCAAGATTCTIGGGVAGLQVNGGNAALDPQKGESWSIGGDWEVPIVENLHLSLTYWHNKIHGAITAPQAAFAVNAAGLNSLLTIFPGGATPAQLAALTAGRPLTTTIPATTYFVYNFQQRNALNLWVEGIDASANYSFDTEVGRFSLDAIASYETRFDQQVGTGGAIFSVKGTTGFNTTFPSIKLNSRVGVDWESKFGLSANVFWNHTGAYRNWSGTTVTPLIRSAQGVPTGGGDKVKAGDTFDLHVAYDVPGDGLTKDLQVFADINNVFDKDPPFYNSNNGYDTFSGNPIGRLTTVGVRKRW
jgi:iron complex outermembrane receptor protein